MPVYDYKGLTPTGANKNGIIDADSPREARIKLRGQNVLVTSITERAGSKKRNAKDKKILDFSRGLKGKNEIETGKLINQREALIFQMRKAEADLLRQNQQDRLSQTMMNDRYGAIPGQEG